MVKNLYFKTPQSKNYYDLLLTQALRFLKSRPKSVKELNNYIKRKLWKFKKISAKEKKDLIQKINNKLTQCGLLNDKEFAQWWVDQRLNFRPKGLRALSYELKEKGIESKIINQVLNSIKIEKLEKAAYKIIEKKLKLYKNLTKLHQRKKLSDHLLRRGFNWQISQKVIDEIIQK